MRFIGYLLVFLLIPLYVFSIDCSLPDCTKVELKKGIIWYHKQYSDLLGGPQNVNIIDVDISDPRIYIKPVYKQSSYCEKTSSMGRRTSAVAGINGGFFDGNNGCIPVGLLKIDNKVITYAVSYRPPRSAVGITADESILFRRTDSTDSFPEAVHAVGGMPNLVTNGGLNVTTSEEQADSLVGVHPRTAICKTFNNHFLMITIDGRATGRTGMSLDNLAQYLIWLGCSDGINLDGGGSTTMWTFSNGVVNYPSDGSERSVSNGLFVYYLDNLPPVIEHTPINSSERTDILIAAKVTDDTGIQAVNLKFRNKGEPNFMSRAMTNKGGDVYEAVIKADEITSNYIQYYIAAWDGALRSTLPSDAESNENYFTIQIIEPKDAGVDVIDDNLDIFIADTGTIEDIYGETAEDIIAVDDFTIADLLNDITEVYYDAKIDNDTLLIDAVDLDIVLDNLQYDTFSDIDTKDILYPNNKDGLDGREDYETEDVSVSESSGCACQWIE